MNEHNRRSDDERIAKILGHAEHTSLVVDKLEKAIFGNGRPGLVIEVDRLKQAKKVWGTVLVLVGAPVVVIVLGLFVTDLYSRWTGNKHGGHMVVKVTP